MKNLRPETLGIVQRVEALSGCPIEFQPDSSLSIQATLQKARHGAAAHVLRYRPGSGPLDYWVAYQCAYALRFYGLPPDLRFDFTDTGEGPDQVATLLTSGQSLPAADLERVPMFAHNVEQWSSLMASPNSPTRGHPKFPQAALPDYDPSAWMAKRAAASLSL
jgi:hypothetical protein